MNQSVRSPEFPAGRLDAAIFDMDGVITRTARLHAAAWKEMFDRYLKRRAEEEGGDFEPFDPGAEYRKYVDGKPRYDGVRSFLESRGISLPEGDPDDPPDRETVCGLGNRKNEIFHRLLDERGVETYDSSLDFVRKLKSRGLRVAVISASKNAEEVLRTAGVLGLFDTKVDGVDARNSKLAGKPDPAIFVEAAKRLGVAPERSAVVEDAQAGVEAGRRGGFGFVIGLDRDGQAAALKDEGADLVVGDLSEVRLGGGSGEGPGEGSGGWASGGGSGCPASGEASDGTPMNALPSPRERRDEIRERLGGRPPAVFLDYDGTLTPIVDDPGAANLPPETREAVKRLAAVCPVAVVSGRDLDDVRRHVDLSGIYYAGSHGFDILTPEGKSHRHEKGKEALPALDRAEEALKQAADGIEGARVERKRFAVALHFRQVADEASVQALERAVDGTAGREPTLRKTGGKKVFELRPAADWDKGQAVLWLLETMGRGGGGRAGLRGGRRHRRGRVPGRPLPRPGNRGGNGGTEDPGPVRTGGPRRDPGLSPVPGRTGGGALMSEWTLSYRGFEPGKEGLREALCTLGNGYFATRGAWPETEADGVHYPGTYFAGVFNRLETGIAGRRIENESVVNAPNWLPFTFRLEGGAWFHPGAWTLHDYRQDLDLRRGVLTRLIEAEDGHGRRVQVTQRRLVSMNEPHLAALQTTIVSRSGPARLHVRSGLDGRVENAGVERYSALNGKHLEPIETADRGEDGIFLLVDTVQSHIRIAEAARTRVAREGEPAATERRVVAGPGRIAEEWVLEAGAGEAVTFEKTVAVCHSRDRAISECGIEVRNLLAHAGGFEDLLREHALIWNQLWRRCSIEIEGDEQASRIVNLHVFHILQTASYHTVDLDVGVPARGLHGEAYRGHIFWDELFVFPFLNYSLPELTRALLLYRFRRLREARWEARKAGYPGAMFPWQSGSDGREESQVLHLNPRSGRWLPDRSHRQRHINIAIAYNVWQYYQATGDLEFLAYYGAEMLFEIARFWAGIAAYEPAGDRYEICGVMGPDEYHDGYPGAEEGGSTTTPTPTSWRCG